MKEDIKIDVLPDTLETYENRIAQAIEDFCLSRNITDLKEESQNVFMACLMYINRQVFKSKKTVFTNRKSVIDYDDISLLEQLADVYIFIAVSFNKTVSYTDFCRMIGIDTQSVNNWKRDSLVNELSRKKFDVMKNITAIREETLSNLLTDGKNRVGTIAILNHQFGWSTERIIHETVNPKLTRSELLQGIENLPEKADVPISISAKEDTFSDS